MKYLLIRYNKKTHGFFENAEELKNSLKEFYLSPNALEEAQERNDLVILDLETEMRVFAEADLEIKILKDR